MITVKIAPIIKASCVFPKTNSVTSFSIFLCSESPGVYPQIRFSGLFEFRGAVICDLYLSGCTIRCSVKFSRFCGCIENCGSFVFSLKICSGVWCFGGNSAKEIFSRYFCALCKVNFFSFQSQ